MSLLKSFNSYDSRIVYLLLFLIVTIPLLSPMGLPISVSPSTVTYYDVIDALGPDDLVLVVLDTEFSGYMEIQSGIIASMRVMVERDAKMCVAVSHPEATGIPELVFAAIRETVEEHGYTYGEDYVILGYVFPNEAAVASAAQDWQGVIHKDFYGQSTEGTFLDQIHDWSDWTLISDYTTGIQSGSLINHFGLRGTPMIVNCIGVMISTQMPYLSTGIYQALLQSMRGGAELEYLTGHPGPGMTAMDAFTLGHYMLIVLIIIGNIGYFGTKENSRRNVE
ncbi:hypothetical protein KKH23_11065 [Patescibacteria group bacterium]|nr:hypothetical protein [Patescibacteria group bacterium]MBU1067626.1 hypothetical protein [Patescibacteria group bacterium]